MNALVLHLITNCCIFLMKHPSNLETTLIFHTGLPSLLPRSVSTNQGRPMRSTPVSICFTWRRQMGHRLPTSRASKLHTELHRPHDWQVASPDWRCKGSSHEKSGFTVSHQRITRGIFRLFMDIDIFFSYVRRIGSSQDGSTDTVGFHVSMEVSLERPRTGSGGKGPFPDGLFFMAYTWGAHPNHVSIRPGMILQVAQDERDDFKKKKRKNANPPWKGGKKKALGSPMIHHHDPWKKSLH